jgi:hypothetical protein
MTSDDAKAQAILRMIQDGPTVENMPEGMRVLVQTALGAGACLELVQAGSWAHAPHFEPQHIHRMVEFLRDFRDDYYVQIFEHPAFAQCFPKEAREIAAQKRALEGPQLLGPDGRPVVPAGEVIH